MDENITPPQQNTPDQILDLVQIDPDVLALQQLQAERDVLPEDKRSEHDEIIAGFLGEIALRDSIMAGAMADIEQAKNFSKQNQKESKVEKPTAVIDFDKIGWINETGEHKIEVDTVHTPELDYDFVDLTGLNRTTNEQFIKLKSQTDEKGRNVLEHVKKELINRTVPNLYRNIKQGKNLRPIGISGNGSFGLQKSLNTSYPAYKENASGTKNRAIILFLGESSQGKPLFGLAALYDHDDSQKIHRALFLGNKKAR